MIAQTSKAAQLVRQLNAIVRSVGSSNHPLSPADIAKIAKRGKELIQKDPNAPQNGKVQQASVLKLLGEASFNRGPGDATVGSMTRKLNRIAHEFRAADKNPDGKVTYAERSEYVGKHNRSNVASAVADLWVAVADRPSRRE